MVFIRNLRGWREPSTESGKVLSLVHASSSVDVLLGEEIGGRTISENQAETGVDIHNIPEHWRDEKHEPNGTSMGYLEIGEAIIASRRVLQADLVDGPIQFTVGVNIWAKFFESEMTRIDGCRILSLDVDK